MRELELERDEFQNLYEDLKNDEIFERNLVEEIDKDDTSRGLFKEMDNELRKEFMAIDKNVQRELVQEIKEGRMTLKEAKELIDKKKK